VISVAQVEAVRAGPCASRGHAESVESLIPRPLLGAPAEDATDAAAANSIADHEPSDHSKGIGLQPALDGNFDPADDFTIQASYKRGLFGGTGAKLNDPVGDLLRSAIVAKLRREMSYGFGIGGEHCSDFDSVVRHRFRIAVSEAEKPVLVPALLRITSREMGRVLECKPRAILLCFRSA
jgi:hypothetical protein